MRVVYMGTPDYACPTLSAIAGTSNVEVSLVVTQPDRPAGRGRSLQAPPVKVLATDLGLPVYQAASLKTVDQRLPIVQAAPDLIVVAAFGLILGKSVLALPRLGCVNLHASILPAYRGASPISAAIANGDPTTGVTLMQMERGLDTGPILAQDELVITDGETTESLTPRLADLAATLLVSNLGALESGHLETVAQPAGATLTRPLVKSDGAIDWSQSSVDIERLVRAMWPWPRATAVLPDGTTIQIHRARCVVDSHHEVPGTVRHSDRLVSVACGDGWLIIERGQFPGGKPQDGRALAQHRQLSDGVVFAPRILNPGTGPMIVPVAGPSA